MNFDVSTFVGEVDENKLIMSGWVIDDNGQHPFVWNSGYNEQGIDFLVSAPNENYFNGSGSNYFERLIIKPDVIRDVVADNEINSTKIIILSQIGYLIANEFLDTELWSSDRFGFGYESLIYNGEEFEYISDTCFFSIDITCNEIGEPLTHSGIHTYVHKYKAIDEVALLQMIAVNDITSETSVIGIGIEISDTAKEILNPMIMNNSHLPIPKFICILIRCSINGKGIARGPLVVPIESSLIRYSEADNKINFGFNPGFGEYFTPMLQAFLKERENS